MPMTTVGLASTSMDYSVRAATPDDAAHLAALHVASWQSAYRGLLPDDVLDNLELPPRERKWAAYLSEPQSRRCTLVACARDDILGFVTVGPNREETAQPDEGELHALYLHPRYWRRRIGSGLHSVALSHLREKGFKNATLWVLDGNERALGFYLQAGWHADMTSRTVVGPSGVPLPENRLRRDLPARTGIDR